MAKTVSDKKLNDELKKLRKAMGIDNLETVINDNGDGREPDEIVFDDMTDATKKQGKGGGLTPRIMAWLSNSKSSSANVKH